MNDESKVRRSTASVVLGKAKVMSYEDLVEARAKRAEKEAAKEAKGKGNRSRKPKSAPEVEETSVDNAKRGRKRKSPTSETDALEPKAKVARMIESAEPWKAPVAQMLPSEVDERSTCYGR